MNALKKVIKRNFSIFTECTYLAAQYYVSEHISKFVYAGCTISWVEEEVYGILFTFIGETI